MWQRTKRTQIKCGFHNNTDINGNRSARWKLRNLLDYLHMKEKSTYIRFSFQNGGHWKECHAKTQQSALRRKVSAT